MTPRTSPRRPASLTRTAAALALLGLLIVTSGCASGGGGQATTTQDKGRAFWPPFPESPHMQFLTSYALTSDVEAKKSKFDEIIYGKESSSNLEVKKPYGLRMHDGKIYVCDTQSTSLTVFDLRKHEVRLIGVSGEGKLSKPVDVAVAPDGYKYVADTQRPAIFVFDPRDKFVRLIGQTDFRPVSLAVHGDGLYVCDFTNHQILVFHRQNGNLLRTIGKPGQAPGELGGPLGIAVDPEGNVYVSEIVNCRIQKFSPDGKSLKTFGNRGDQPGTFTRPKHIALDAEGNLYVVDTAFQNVQVLDKDFKPLMAFGGHGNFPGYMDLPAGVAISEADVELFKEFVHPAFAAKRLGLVTNQWGDNRIAVYAMGELKPGKTVDDIAASKSVVPQDWVGGATTGTPAIGPVDPKAKPKDAN
jgi:DNA-binding beta-propeller fold protein YncE